MKAVTFFVVTLLATVAVAAAAAPAAATGGHRGEERIRFRGPLSGDQEVPPVHTAAWGTVRARLRGGTDLAVRFSFAGLGSPVNESIGIRPGTHGQPRRWRPPEPPSPPLARSGGARRQRRRRRGRQRR